MSGLRKLGTLLERWEPLVDAPPGDGSAAVSIAWTDAVGPEVGRRTRPGRLRDGVLTVYTAASTWSHQLTFLAPSILAELRVRCPDVQIDRLRFVVASGAAKALIDGAARRALPRLRGTSAQRPSEPDAVDNWDDAVEDVIARLRRRQAALDRRRRRDGWTQCAQCGAWRDPRVGDVAVCAVCAYERERAGDQRIERVLTNAPWLPRGEILSHVQGSDEPAYERVRRRLLARWEQQLFGAKRRLRRGDLHASDRVIAWSYLMLRSGMQQHVIGRAVIADLLGADWAAALAPATAREATISGVQKQRKTNARAFQRRDTRT